MGGSKTTAQSTARMTRTTSVKASRPPLLSTTVTTDYRKVVDRSARSRRRCSLARMSPRRQLANTPLQLCDEISETKLVRVIGLTTPGPGASARLLPEREVTDRHRTI